MFRKFSPLLPVLFVLGWWCCPVAGPSALAQSNIIGGGLIGNSVATTPPVPTWLFSATDDTNLSTAVQVWATRSIGSATPQRFFVLGIGGAALSTSVTSLTIAPNVGSTVTATRIAVDSTTRVALYQAVLLSDANTATTATFTLTYSSNPFASTPLSVWTVPSGNMSSQTATGTGSNNVTSNTTTSTTINTTSGGFMIALSRDSAGGTSNFTGSTETFTQRSNISDGTPTYAAADAQGIATNASSSVVTTFSISGNIQIVAAAWR